MGSSLLRRCFLFSFLFLLSVSTAERHESLSRLLRNRHAFSRPLSFRGFTHDRINRSPKSVNLTKAELISEQQNDGQAFHVKMVHRSSPGSPHYKSHYANKTELLAELMAMDNERQGQIHRVLISAQAKKSRKSGAKNASATLESSAFPILDSPGSNSLRAPLISGSTLGSGQYFVDFRIGTPEQRFSLVADTGSDLIWLQCSPCQKCFKQSSALFSPSKSSSYSAIRCNDRECFMVPAPPGDVCNTKAPLCNYMYLYNDDSQTSGVFAYETITMAGVSQANPSRLSRVAFGCGTHNTGNFMGSAGVLGLGQGSISFPSQIGHMFGSKFSYCLVSYFTSTKISSTLIFGEARYKSGSPINGMQFTPFLKNPVAETYYYVGISQIYVNSYPIRVPRHLWALDSAGNGGTIIDSGSTLTYFREPAYSQILKAFDQAISYPRAPSSQGFKLCIDLTGINNPRLPDLGILFNWGAYLKPPAENYFIQVAQNVKCLAFLPVRSSAGYSILGNLMQQNYHFEYDRGLSRLGFVPYDCSAATP